MKLEIELLRDIQKPDPKWGPGINNVAIEKKFKDMEEKGWIAWAERQPGVSSLGDWYAITNQGRQVLEEYEDYLETMSPKIHDWDDPLRELDLLLDVTRPVDRRIYLRRPTPQLLRKIEQMIKEKELDRDESGALILAPEGKKRLLTFQRLQKMPPKTRRR